MEGVRSAIITQEATYHVAFLSLGVIYPPLGPPINQAKSAELELLIRQII